MLQPKDFQVTAASGNLRFSSPHLEFLKLSNAKRKKNRMFPLLDHTETSGPRDYLPSSERGLTRGKGKCYAALSVWKRAPALPLPKPPLPGGTSPRTDFGVLMLLGKTQGPATDSGSSLTEGAGNAAPLRGQLFSRSWSKRGWKHPAWKTKLLVLSVSPAPQFPQLLKLNQCSCPGTGHPKHFHRLE